MFKYRNCPTYFSCWLNWSTEIENSFSKTPKKGAWHVGTGLGEVREGKNQHYNNIVAPQQLQQKYQPCFQGSLPPAPAEQERGRRENLGMRLQKYKIAGSTQFEKLDSSNIKKRGTLH